MGQEAVRFNLEPRFERPVNLLKNLFSEHEFLIPLSYQMSKYKYEFWHMVSVPLAYKGTIGKLGDKGEVSGDTYEFLETGVVAAHLHDIGKFGIVRGSIDKSLQAMNYVKPGFVPSGDQRDGRPPEIRALQHLHPLIGGYAINYLIEVGLIPEEIGLKIKSGVYSHHETEKDSFKPPYPRRINGRRLEVRDRRQVLSDFLIMLTDVAVSMRSIRPYRNKVLEYPVIEQELDLYLQDEELLEYIQPLFGKTITEIKASLRDNVLSATSEIDGLVRTVPDMNQIDWNGYYEVPEAISLGNIMESVWDVNWGALENAYKKEYERDFVHQTRVP